MVRTACAAAFVLMAAPAMAQDGAVLYAQACSICHDGGVVRAPARRALGEMTPERIVASLETGLMRAQGASLNDEQRRAVAVFVSGKPLGAMNAPVTAPRCTRAPGAFTSAPSSAWKSPAWSRRRTSRMWCWLNCATMPGCSIRA